jgi:tripartite ATP-independent transporter DctM subunit
MMIVYAMLAQISVGKLLIAGFLPGIMTALTFSLMIIIRCIKNPKLGPKGPSTTWREKITSLKGIIVVGIVLIIILGGLYSGIFTPTEAAAWSALVMLLSGFIIQRGFKWSLFKESLKDTATNSCMIFMILIGVTLMSTALISSGVIGTMVSFFEGLEVSKYVLLLAAVIIYVILGAFVGVLGMLVMTVPFIIPILETAGFDPIWLGVFAILFVEIGLITPPIGTNVFVIATVTGRDVSHCFKAVVPFLIMQLVNLVLLVAFPAIVLFLPSHM